MRCDGLKLICGWILLLLSPYCNNSFDLSPNSQITIIGTIAGNSIFQTSKSNKDETMKRLFQSKSNMCKRTHPWTSSLPPLSACFPVSPQSAAGSDGCIATPSLMWKIGVSSGESESRTLPFSACTAGMQSKKQICLEFVHADGCVQTTQMPCL